MDGPTDSNGSEYNGSEYNGLGRMGIWSCQSQILVFLMYAFDGFLIVCGFSSSLPNAECPKMELEGSALPYGINADSQVPLCLHMIISSILTAC